MDACADEEESPYSEQALALLAAPDSSMPEAVAKLDPQIVNTICNEIIESSSAIQWDDIAGMPQSCTVCAAPALL
jgi:hypothetical protein